MHRFVTALAVLGVVTMAAHAQETQEKPKPAEGEGGPTGLAYHSATDTVVLYGLLDVTISNITNADASGHQKFGYQTSWFSGNRWGITGKHIVGGLEPNFGVIFRLESEYTLPTGEMDTPNVLFNRDAWIGFEGKKFGKLTFGRQ